MSFSNTFLTPYPKDYHLQWNHYKQINEIFSVFVLGLWSPVCIWHLWYISVWRRKWQPTPVFLPGESLGRRSLVGCSPGGRHRVGHDWSDLAAAAAVCTSHISSVPWKDVDSSYHSGQCSFKACIILYNSVFIIMPNLAHFLFQNFN